MPEPGMCKYCGTELSDYRDFCNWACQKDFEDDRADYDREINQFEFTEGVENE